jgi:hypothetical protein
MSALPEFEGWTVDERLREFRRVAWRKGVPSMRTLKFSSKEGARLRHAYELWRGREAGRELMRKPRRPWSWSASFRVGQ